MKKNNIFYRCKKPNDYIAKLRFELEKNHYSFYQNESGKDFFGELIYRIYVSTGGWSENEDILKDLRDTTFWLLYWVRSERGWHFTFEIPISQMRNKKERRKKK